MRWSLACSPSISATQPTHVRRPPTWKRCSGVGPILCRPPRDTGGGVPLVGCATTPPARIPVDAWRKPTAGRHMIDSDLMWFAWALHLEASHLLAGQDNGHARRTLQLAGIATACPANFAWRGHRRTRPEYRRDEGTTRLLRQRGMQWASNFDASAQEIHTLYSIRER